MYLRKMETGENCPMWNHRSSAPLGPLHKKKKRKKMKMEMRAIAVSIDIICILQFYDDYFSLI